MFYPNYSCDGNVLHAYITYLVMCLTCWQVRINVVITDIILEFCIGNV